MRTPKANKLQIIDLLMFNTLIFVINYRDLTLIRKPILLFNQKNIFNIKNY